MTAYAPTEPLSQDHAFDALPTIDMERDAILFDIDGTLIDIAPTPADVFLPAGLDDTLSRLMNLTGGAVALVSGRTMASIDALFAPLKIAAVGCHGAEIRREPELPVETQIAPLPAEVVGAFADVAALHPGVQVEDKRFALAFHFRQARDQEAALCARLEKRLEPFRPALTLMRGKSVFEIKSRYCTKGTALCALMRAPPFAGRRPVYLGDDTTDEYAFAALREFGGIGVAVGRRLPHADYLADEPLTVRRWLERLTCP